MVVPVGSISDANPYSLRGIAVIALSGSATVTWQYSTNKGTTCSPIPTTGSPTALLLASVSVTRIRYVTNSGFTGSHPRGNQPEASL